VLNSNSLLAALKGEAKVSTRVAAYHDPGKLYADQGELIEAGQMYQRARQGYEKALGKVDATTYIPALNTIYASPLSSRFEML